MFRDFVDNIWRVYRFRFASTYPGRTLVITTEAGDPQVTLAFWQKCPRQAKHLLQGYDLRNPVTTGGIWR